MYGKHFGREVTLNVEGRIFRDGLFWGVYVKVRGEWGVEEIGGMDEWVDGMKGFIEGEVGGVLEGG